MRDAKRIAFGSIASDSLSQYYAAWQWLHDNGVELSEADRNYIDKLICDGVII